MSNTSRGNHDAPGALHTRAVPNFRWSSILIGVVLLFGVAACGGQSPLAVPDSPPPGASTSSPPSADDSGALPPPSEIEPAPGETAPPVVVTAAVETPDTTPAPLEPITAESRILIIGDSISIGYQPGVEDLLGHPEPLVVHNEGNAQSTNHALSSNRLQTWVGDGNWDVIHFNFGLHDLAWADQSGVEQIVGTEGAAPRVPLDEYADQLQQVIDVLRPTGARLVFATTTPVYATEGSRSASAELAYNAVAMQVMQRNGILVNDLHAFALANIREDQRTDNVHFDEDGYDTLAKSVVDFLTANP